MDKRQYQQANLRTWTAARLPRLGGQVEDPVRGREGRNPSIGNPINPIYYL